MPRVIRNKVDESNSKELEKIISKILSKIPIKIRSNFNTVSVELLNDKDYNKVRKLLDQAGIKRTESVVPGVINANWHIHIPVKQDAEFHDYWM